MSNYQFSIQKMGTGVRLEHVKKHPQIITSNLFKPFDNHPITQELKKVTP